MPRVAGAAQMRTASTVRPYSPTSDPACMSQPFWARAMPSVFQGKPVNRVPRSHSLTASPKARAKMRPAPRRPDGAGEGEPAGRKEGEPRRQAEHAERQRPSELLGFHQERGAEPPQAGHEVAEPPPPADDGRGAKRREKPAASSGRPVDEPDGDGQREREGRQEAERRHRQGAGGAGEERDQRAAPSPSQDDALRDARHAAELRGLASSVAAGSAGSRGDSEGPSDGVDEP